MIIRQTDTKTMRLKDLVMQTTYEKIEPAIKTKYDSKGLVYDDQKK